jgi:hypothetical protein
MLAQQLRIIAPGNRNPAYPEYQHGYVSFVTTVYMCETQLKLHSGKFGQEASPNGLGDQAKWPRRRGRGEYWAGALTVSFSEVAGGAGYNDATI